MALPDRHAHANPLLRHLREEPDASLRWLRVGALFDAGTATVIRNFHLVFDRARIHHAGTEAPDPGLVAETSCIDLPDTTVLPGLFDAHTHIAMAGAELDPARRAEDQGRTPTELRTAAEARSRSLVALGIVGMRDGGDKHGVGLFLSQRSQPETGQPDRTIPRIFSPGAGIHRAGRYGSFFSRPVEDHCSMEECVRERTSLGADHVKIVPTGIINFKKGTASAKPQFSPEEVAEASRTAKALKCHLMAHASGTEGIQNAIEGRVDTIEHGYFITRDQLAFMRDHGIAWVPTFAPVWCQLEHADEMGWDATVRDNLRRILDDHASSLQSALEMGVTVLVGSDAGSCGVAHGAGLLDEMRLLEEAGMSVQQILARACGGNARTLFMETNPPPLATGDPAAFILAPAEVTRRSAALEDAYALFAGEVNPLSSLRSLPGL